MKRNLAMLMSLAFVSGSIALSAQPAEAKMMRKSNQASRDYFVPPPPAYTPSLVPMAMDEAMLAPYGKYSWAGDQDRAQLIRSAGVNSRTMSSSQSPGVIYNPSEDARALKQIEHIDSEIADTEQEIYRLLNL